MDRNPITIICQKDTTLSLSSSFSGIRPPSRPRKQPTDRYHLRSRPRKQPISCYHLLFRSRKQPIDCYHLLSRPRKQPISCFHLLLSVAIIYYTLTCVICGLSLGLTLSSSSMGYPTMMWPSIYVIPFYFHCIVNCMYILHLKTYL